MKKLFALTTAGIIVFIFIGVFFGANIEGARIGLELVGILYLLQITYKVVKDNWDQKD